MINIAFYHCSPSPAENQKKSWDVEKRLSEEDDDDVNSGDVDTDNVNAQLSDNSDRYSPSALLSEKSNSLGAKSQSSTSEINSSNVKL